MSRENSGNAASASTQVSFHNIPNTSSNPVALSLDTVASGLSVARPSQISQPTRPGDTEQYFLEDLNRYKELLDDPARNSITLGVAISQLKRAQNYERGSLKTFTSTIEGRSNVFKRLLPQFEQELKRLVSDEDVGGAGDGIGEMDVDEESDKN